MPWNQEKYQQAKSLLGDPALSPEKRQALSSKITEFESDQARGYQRAPEVSQPTLGDVDAQFGPSYLAQSKSPTADAIRETGAALTPEAMEARRQQTDWTKKLTTNPGLKNASKLKVFDDPPDYEPPKPLSGMIGSALSAVRPTTSYFEPTPGEFRAVMMSNPRVKAALQEQYPDYNLEELPESALEDSGAFKAYADARWQHALAGALKTRTPITRVAFSDKTGEVGPDGQRKLNLTGHASNLMDNSMSLMTGALQGATGGLYDLGMTGLDKALPGDEPGLLSETRDAGRGSRERNPITATVGTVAGALDPRQLPGKIAGGLGGLASKVAPKSLPGRVGAGAAIGAATGVIDENMRAAANLAADALDADKSARETALMIAQGLPLVTPVTAGAGAVIGGAADLAGAGLGTVNRAMTQSDRLRAPLKHFEESGGKMGPLMGRRVSPEAQKYQARADTARTTPQDIIVDEVADSLATQRLLEQESAIRSGEQATSVAQAKLDGKTVSPAIAAERIRVEAGSMPAATPQAKAAQKNLMDFADRLSAKERLTAAELDSFLQEVDDAAKFGKNTEPVGHWKQAGKHVRDLRDELKYDVDATVVTNPPDKGVFTADAEATVADVPAKQVGGVRDKRGNVKAVEDYSADKLRQSKLQGFHKDMNKRLGLPEELSAEPVLSEPYVSKGVFDPKTPQEIVEGIPPKARLNEDQRRGFEGAIRKTSGRDYLKNRREMEALAERTDDAAVAAGRKGDLPIVKKLQIVRQLDDKDQLSQALGAAVDQMNSSGFANIGMLKKIGFRAIPTLKSLSGGLPAKPTTPGVSDQAVARLREFIPEWEALHLRGGKPARVLGAARDREEPQESKFSPEEKAFWIKVIEKMAEQNKPQKVAGQ